MATAFRILLQSRRDEVPRGDVEQALQALEEAVLRTINVFGTQELANIMHAMAKAHYTPTNPLVLGPLEPQTEALADTFNTQDVANTIWAYATMGRGPGAGLMRVLEGRAEALAGTFKAQGVANTLWAYATMGRNCGNRPAATFLVLRHFGEHCLHPALVPFFIPVANMQDVGLESPRARVSEPSGTACALLWPMQLPRRPRFALARTRSSGGRCDPRSSNEKPGMAVDEVNKALDAEWSKLADAQSAKYNKTADSSGAGTAVEDSDDGLDQVWALVSEVYERPMVLEASIENEETAIPPRLQDADHWELLMWAAITCAKQWIRMQATSNPTLNPRHGSRF